MGAASIKEIYVPKSVKIIEENAFEISFKTYPKIARETLKTSLNSFQLERTKPKNTTHPPLMSTFAFSVVRMAVFCPPLSRGDDDTHKKVLFYHPKTDDSNTREIHIGVFETIAYFGRDKAGADVTLIETTNCKICLSEPEPGVFISLALKKPSAYDPERSVMDVLPGVM